jgi:hypothetical protein
LPDGHFNPSMLMWQNRLVMATRDSWGHSRVALWYLDNNLPDWSGGTWTVTPIGSYASGHRDAPRLEDPRLFVAPGPDGQMRLHAAFNLPDGYPPKLVQVGYSRFSENLSCIEETRVFKSPQDSAYEKNWSPFWSASANNGDGGLRWIYGMKPAHIILGFGTRGEGIVSIETENPLPWTGGVMRGGAAPVRVGDEFYVFFHGCLKRFSGSVYTAGCYVFDANAPYRIKRQTATPLIWPELPSIDEDVVKSYVVWPGGAVLHQGNWWLALGIDDCFVQLKRFSYDEVELAMTDVPEPPATAMGLRESPLALGTRGAMG